DHDGRVEALDELIDRAKAVRKSNGKLKPVADHLADLIKLAEKERAQAVQAAEAAEDEDEDGALDKVLAARLKRAQRMKADAARRCVIALGQVSGLMVAKTNAVSREERAQARGLRTGKGKLLHCACFGEKGKLVFLFEDRPPGGLARNLRKSILAHTKKASRV